MMTNGINNDIKIEEIISIILNKDTKNISQKSYHFIFSITSFLRGE